MKLYVSLIHLVFFREAPRRPSTAHIFTESNVWNLMYQVKGEVFFKKIEIEF